MPDVVGIFKDYISRSVHRISPIIDVCLPRVPGPIIIVEGKKRTNNYVIIAIPIDISSTGHGRAEATVIPNRPFVLPNHLQVPCGIEVFASEIYFHVTRLIQCTLNGSHNYVHVAIPVNIPGRRTDYKIISVFLTPKLSHKRERILSKRYACRKDD